MGLLPFSLVRRSVSMDIFSLFEKMIDFISFFSLNEKRLHLLSLLVRFKSDSSLKENLRFSMAGIGGYTRAIHTTELLSTNPFTLNTIL